MIRHIKHIDIDKEKWDKCIKNAFNGLIYGYSWYLDIVAGEWDALVENDYERVFPLTGNKKAGFHYLFQPPFTQQLGIFSQSLLSEEKVGEFLDAIPKSIKFIEININSFNKVNNPKFRIEPWVTYQLDLIKTYEGIRSGYSDNLKRNLRKAGKAGLSISKNLKPDEIISLFRNNRGKTLKHISDADYMKLRRLVYMAIYKGAAQTYGVYDQINSLCAGAIFLKSHQKQIFFFSGANETARDLNAMAFLIDGFIREHAHHTFTFDFEGSNNPGLARFYSQFGSKKCFYFHLAANRLPFPVSLLLRLKKFLIK